MDCLVSVVIPCYNHGEYIEEALASVETNAGETTYEIIIIDDGSSDELTIEVLQVLKDKGYAVIRQANQGLAAARNNGIKLAKGKYIIPLDSDNKLHQNYLTTAVRLLERDSQIDVVYGNPVFFGNSNDSRELGVRELGAFDFVRILEANYIDACAVFKKSVWEKVGGYDGAMPAMGHEDWEIWIRIFLAGGKFYYLNEVCFYYRVIAGSMLTTNAVIKHNSNKEYIYRKHHTAIIAALVKQIEEVKAAEQYIQHNKLRSMMRLLVGKPLQGDR